MTTDRAWSRSVAAVPFCMAALSMLAACDDDPVEPLPDPPALSVRLEVSDPAVSLTSAAGRIDSARVRLSHAGLKIDSIVTSAAVGQDLPLEPASLKGGETVNLSVVAYEAGVETFTIDTTVTVAAGANSAILTLQPVLGSFEPVLMVSAGEAHACSLNTHGQTFCWGATEGAGGSAAPVASAYGPTPALVSTPEPLAALSVGGSHRCGLTAAGALYCWGENIQGQVGDGTTTHRAEPVKIDDGPWRAVDAGLKHSCAIAQDGAVSCWGGNGRNTVDDIGGPLGFLATDVCPVGDTYYGDVLCAKTPTPVAGLTATQVSSGLFHSCAVTSDGPLCWGWNRGLQLALDLGEDTPADASPTPVPVEGLPGTPSSIHAGTLFSCALVAGTPWCWGNMIAGRSAAFDYGQFGDGAQDGNPVPAPAQTSASLVSLEVAWANSVSNSTVCGLDAAGTAHCWGPNGDGQIGVASGGTVCAQISSGDLDCAVTPVAVDTDLRFTQLSAGLRFTCGRTTTARAACWGLNENGELGDGTTTGGHMPRLVGGAGGGASPERHAGGIPAASRH